MIGIANIGPGLVRARKNLGVSQRELGRRVGVQQPQIARWERNTYRTATLERIDAVASALGLDEPGLIDPEVPVAAETAAPHATTRPAPPSTDALLTRIGTNRRELSRLCRRHAIQELAVFGSALREDFGPESDIDLLIRFGDSPPQNPEAREVLQEEIEALVGRRVDLVERARVERGENHIRRRRILGSARVVYVA